MTISSFRDNNAFLSNFYPSPIHIRHGWAATVEHAYQASKCFNEADAKAILALPSPGEAKRMGRVITMTHNWNFYKLRVMDQLLRLKFNPESELAEKLVATGDERLIESNTWGDTYWGVYQGIGENNLGKLLMKIREDLTK